MYGMERQQESIRVVAKSDLTWWEKERKLVQNGLDELVVALDEMKLPRVECEKSSDAAFNIKQKQTEELRDKLKI